MRDELAALLTVIEVEHRRRHVVDLEGRRVAEDEQLDERRNDQAEARIAVAPELLELLDDEIENALPHLLIPVSS